MLTVLTAGRDTDQLVRKIALLEKDLDTAEDALKEKTELYRAAELKAEQFERKCRILEQERDDLENELEEKIAQLKATKAELDETLRSLDSM